MSTQLTDLKSLIEFASGPAEKIFRINGEIEPMYHAITAGGEHIVMMAPGEDKDSSVALMKAAFILKDVDRYVYVNEAWILDARFGLPQITDAEMAKIRRHGVRNHPDRREIVMFAAENRRGEMQTARRYILRPEHGKARLSPLQIDDMTGIESEGRMVGLLQPEK